jgi:predicted amidohydrolase
VTVLRTRRIAEVGDMERFVLACAQMASRPMAVEENLERALDLVARAAVDCRAQLVVLPETVTTGFSPGCDKRELWLRVEPLPGALCERVGKVARQLRVHLAYPTYERGGEEGVVYNSVALFGATGELLAVYRKTHLFPTERGASGGWSTAGASPVVVRTPLGGVGLTLCYDGDFPELYRCEALAGAEVILRPSAFLRSLAIWKLTNAARAFDNQVFVAACNAVGSDARGNCYYGHSMIVSPSAEILTEGQCDEEIVATEVAPPVLPATDHLRDRNLQAYQSLFQSPARPDTSR